MSNLYLHSTSQDTLRTSSLCSIVSDAQSVLQLLKRRWWESLHGASWLTQEEQAEAVKKVVALGLEVGANDHHWDISFVNKSHSELQFDADMSFLELVTELYRSFRSEMFLLYNTPIDKQSFIWSYTVQPYLVNAFHLQSTNSIVFPEAFFYPPYYRSRAPEYINYGATAAAMAHEIFHGLDVLGLRFDHQGNMNSPFSSSALDHLNTTHSCYHHLLSQAFYTEVQFEYGTVAMEIDSSTSINEDLADTEGIRHAFRAYHRWVRRHYPEPRLPALQHNPDQLFFLAAAQPYCAVLPDLAKIFLMEVDEHLPNDLRVNSIMMNTPEFSRAFNCSPPSRMSPPHTCHVFQ
ncbi:hypothetical protein Pcinc_030363 [Petrolisthes cinctipes]|uniref:Peptidase M13 C-terminal domain-containing protein n=2 Tax=Petrolisthes cinctipes TaxID=88211 RepID=A0AAE1K6F9_PETCI|nr:hypothetical protein Pcinc_030363 [Petrolisthes cinctipes]